MKKMYILFTLLILVVTTNAQPFTSVWRKTTQSGASDLTWFNNTGGSIRSLAYNPITNKVYVALTSGSATGDSVFIFNANTGVVEGKLRRDGVGIGSEIFKNLRVRVSNDGFIYSSSLSVADGSFQRCKIYRWASEADTATLAASFVTSERCGDALAITGIGVDTKIYVAGLAYARDYVGVNDSTAQKIYILTTTNGLNFSKTDSIRLISTKTSAANPWIRSLDPISDNFTDGFWINNIGRTTNRIEVSGTPGAYTASIALSIPAGNGNGQASNAYGNVKYFKTAGNKKLIAMAGAWFSGITNTVNTGVVMRMVNVTDEASLSTVGTDTLRGVNNTDTLLKYSTHLQGAGDIAFRENGDGSINVYYVSTNNGIACARSATTLPVELSKFTAQLFKNNVKLNWATASEINNAGFVIEKSISGEKFGKIGFVNAKGNTQNNYEFLDENAVNTKASEVYYRLKQMDKDGKFTYSNVEVVKLPTKNNFTVSTFENPFNNQIKLQVGVEKESLITVTITNVEGKIIKTTKVLLQKGNNNITIPANDFANGQYFVTLNNGNVNQTLSVLKH
jgi:hypothetical protein